MPQGPTDPRTLRKKVKEAAEALRAHNRPDLAAAIDELLERKSANPEHNLTPNMPTYVSKSAWTRAQTAAAAVHRRTMEDEINDGFTALLAGTWVPSPPRRAAYGQGAADRTTRTVRMPATRTAEVAAYVAANAERLGWDPTPAKVAAAWIEEKYPAPAAENTD
ncbi:hypothetical protein [Kitasatospora sp. NPDC090091]|uniref:hypothetical protein n=1 Tax=Kitasatospora sp. NPDC090091 TaxID=3364081 RepID=UPI0037F45154